MPNKDILQRSVLSLIYGIGFVSFSTDTSGIGTITHEQKPTVIRDIKVYKQQDITSKYLLATRSRDDCTPPNESPSTPARFRSTESVPFAQLGNIELGQNALVPDCNTLLSVPNVLLLPLPELAMSSKLISNLQKQHLISELNSRAFGAEQADSIPHLYAYLSQYLKLMENELGEIVDSEVTQLYKDMFGDIPQTTVPEIIQHFEDRDIFETYMSQLPVTNQLATQLQNIPVGHLVFLQTAESSAGFNQFSDVLIVTEGEIFVNISSGESLTVNEVLLQFYGQIIENADSPPPELKVKVVDIDQYLQSKAQFLAAAGNHLDKIQMDQRDQDHTGIQEACFYGMSGSWGVLGHTSTGERTQDPQVSLDTLVSTLTEVEVFLDKKLDICIEFTYAHPDFAGTDMIFNATLEANLEIFRQWAERNNRNIRFSINVKTDEGTTLEEFKHLYRDIIKGNSLFLTPQMIEMYDVSFSTDDEYLVSSRTGIQTGDMSKAVQIPANFYNQLAFETMLARAKISRDLDETQWPTTWSEILEQYSDVFGTYDIGQGSDGFISDVSNLLPQVQIHHAGITQGTDAQAVLANKVMSVELYHQRRTNGGSVDSIMLFIEDHLGGRERERYTLAQALEVIEESQSIRSIIFQ